MARKQRVEFAGAIFHIWLRRVERTTLFVDAADYGRYVSLLAEVAKEYGWIVHEFCLMPNHVHLLIELTEPNLERGLHHLHRNYVRWFNDRHNRSGRLFEHRPQWKAVEDEIYFVTVVSYIARNPVDAGLCGEPEGWLWSGRGWRASHPAGVSWLADGEHSAEPKDGTRFRL